MAKEDAKVALLYLNPVLALEMKLLHVGTGKKERDCGLTCIISTQSQKPTELFARADCSE